ncbi:MAG: glycine zipper 2TM domain-containing protein [Massilia sp.]|nr:glycine zipper 2TM domain-containing protein [Massilia sp.]
MLNKKCLGAMMLAAALVSSTAMADDRGVNTAFGAVIGAGIGNSTGARNGALIGGLLGAAVGSSISTNDRSYSNGGYDDYRGSGYVDSRATTTTYYDNRDSRDYWDSRDYRDSRDAYDSQPAPVYVQDSRTVYVEQSRPVYYQQQPVYYYNQPYYSQPSAAVYVGVGGGGYRDGYRGYNGHGHGHGHRR